MKKTISIFVILAVCVSLVGCGSSAKLNENNIRVAKSVINSVDAYLDGTKSAEVTLREVKAEYDNVDPNDENVGERLMLDLKISSIRLQLIVDHGDVAIIKEARDEIATLAGLPKYKG